jgi:hypothetical protein
MRGFMSDPIGKSLYPSSYAGRAISAGEIFARAYKEIGLLKAPCNVVSAQPYWHERTALRPQPGVASGALFWIGTNATVIPERCALKAESPVVVKSDHYLGARLLRRRNEIRPDSDRIMNMDEFCLMRADQCPEVACCCWTVKAGVWVQVLESYSIDWHAIHLVEIDGARLTAFGLKGAGEHRHIHASRREASYLTIGNDLSAPEDCRRIKVTDKQHTSDHLIFPRHEQCKFR